MKIAELGEFKFISRLRQRSRPGAGVRLGIGDDCAAVEIPPGELLLTTTDLLIEEVHFRRDWTDWRLLGRKSVSVNVSDIAAMGGTPRYLYLALGLPADLEVTDIDAFMDGFGEAAADYGAVLAGGDTCRSPGPLLISVTAEGSIPEGELVGRGSARLGHAVYVSGTLGDSALALQQMLSGRISDPCLAARHHDPTARTSLGRALAAGKMAGAMIDLSDGLLADLGHILVASGVGAQIDQQSLPLSSGFRKAVREDPALLELALTGGEDYELLFTVPPPREEEVAQVATRIGVPLTRVGVVTAGSDLLVHDSEGKQVHSRRRGFDHFSGV